MKYRINQVTVEVGENSEIVISQEQRDDKPPAKVAIWPEQVESLHDLLQKAVSHIEELRRKTEEPEELDNEEDDFESGHSRQMGNRRK